MMLLPMLMLTAQAASEAIRHGDPVTWPAVGLAGVAAVGSWLSIIFNNRKWKASGNCATKSIPVEKPGTGKKCQEHGEAIAGLVQFKETTSEALTKIDGKLDRLIEKFIGKA